MGFNISYKEHNEDSLEVYLTSIISDSEKLKKSMLETSADKVKEKVVANLNKHRRSIEKRYKNRPAIDCIERLPKKTINVVFFPVFYFSRNHIIVNRSSIFVLCIHKKGANL